MIKTPASQGPMLDIDANQELDDFDLDFLGEDSDEQSHLEEEITSPLDYHRLKDITRALNIEFPPDAEINRLIYRITLLINCLKEAQDIYFVSQACKDKELMWCLLVIVKSSATSLAKKIEMGSSAANAITILNYARYN